jgi:uncharacterized protein DUF6907
MAQPMTQTITNPTEAAEFIDLQFEPTDNPTLPCPDFCDGTCTTRPEVDGDAHHTSGFASLTVPSDRIGKFTDLDVSVSRTDDDFQPGTPVVNLLGFVNGGTTLPASLARELAAMLLNAADIADPLPAGVMPIEAKQVRIGDEISTPDGWQKVVGQMAFLASDDSAAQVNVWTDDYDHDPDTDGWKFEPGDIVHVRRPLHGSCAIAFVEPIR